MKEKKTGACVAAGHDIMEASTKKRFYECGECGERKTVLGMKATPPRSVCAKCGTWQWKATSVRREWKGAKQQRGPKVLER